MKKIYIFLFFLFSLSIHAEEVVSEYAAVSKDFQQGFKDELFGPNTGYSWMGVPTEEYDQKVILGARSIYCAKVADILDKPLEAIKLFNKGAENLNEYSNQLNVRNSVSTKYNSILRFSKPSYVLGSDVIKGMIIESIISSIDEQFYTLGSDKKARQSQLKIFYADECTSYL
ncbi:Uncharacterised protein [Acinetobacter baumannii]|uniref:hypothetical protein n=1 Tax=Acinetobacter baumannii TaxID=470 RepID=UPI0002AED7D0|nr:hypothetical protein [Acinetobacter baumannii]EHU1357217.1 hypothetical protein [Acinetobacter baumannii]EHU2501076.1 hypothetical protein [Acinetobacter baumannii]ELW97682.1 hypothetical protein ACIN5047_2489 [Acinetobacter baumannii OIFC047]ENV26601.1 hypothetical protein F962_01107 [Acinetobacter baumannii NIPH 190]KQD37566.1 hypothetical protein APD11_05945 [Acinetobacter baumannii]